MLYLIKNNSTCLEDHLQAEQSSLSRTIVVMWLMGTVVLLPVKVFSFPLNMELVDFWILWALPIFWVFFILKSQTIISWSYTLAMLFILIGSFISIFAAPNPFKSLVVVVKGGYIFVWFVTLTALLARLSASELRSIMFVWSGTVILHGLLIIAQFLLPEIWRITCAFAGQSAAYEHFRPSGLFISEKAGDANKAAVFQLVGFVPLLLMNASKRITAILAIVLFSSILATGSMGNTMAFMAGLTTAIVALAVFGKNSFRIGKHLMRLVIGAFFLGGLFFFVLSQNQAYQRHFESIIVGRAEKSSGGRFDLWQRGLDVLIDHNGFLWGVGPENFREVDAAQRDNQLHNDFLAFTVERGLLAVVGLMLFAVMAVSRALYLLKMHIKNAERPRPEVVVFLGTLVAVLVISLTHQIFHARELWLLIALQEAMVFKVTLGRG